MSISGGTLIYSMWKGYLEQDYMKKLVDYTESKNIKTEFVHTTGNADIDTLKELVDKAKPKYIIPIHTTNPDGYKSLFGNNVIIVNDKEVIAVEK